MGDQDDERLESMISRSFVERGELLPTKVGEVLDTHVEDVDLPASLQAFDERRRPAAEPAATPAAPRGRPLRTVALVGAGIAALAAGYALYVGSDRPEAPIVGDAARSAKEQPAGSSSAAPPASVPVPIERPACDASTCCAGASCGSAKGELASCPTERTCIPCSGLDEPEARYRVRIGDLSATDPKAPELAHLDLCVKVGDPNGAWACAPAREPSSLRPRGRFLSKASTATDLGAGIAMELRVNGKEVFGKWWSIVKVAPRSLCRGQKVVFKNERDEEVGTLSMFFSPTYYVELARRESRAAVDAVEQGFAFDGLAPTIVEAGPRHVLTIGPFDRGEAEAILRRVQPLAPEARIGTGDDYRAW